MCRLTALLLLLVPAISRRATWAATSDWVSGQHGAARLISAVEATGSSTQLDVGLQLRLTTGWHTYWRSPGDAGIPLAVDRMVTTAQ
jgi:suppressor for copper-sensitivity B